MEKVLTISIAAYNAENDIRRCLDSFVNTDVFNKLEVIVVNDGSKDKTLEIANEYRNRYPNSILVVDKENGGHGSTINASIKRASGKYYKIVDSDDWVDKDGLEKLVYKLEKLNADLVLNPYHDIDAATLKRKTLIKPYGSNTKMGELYSVDDVNGIVIYMHSTTFKTSVIKKMGPNIDEKCFYVDMEYTIFPLQYVQTYICFDFPVYQYLMGTATQSMNKNSLINRRNQHLRVTKRIIEYYENNKDDMKIGIREMVLLRVRLAMLNQYKIYFNMDAKESKDEIVAFDHWVKDTSAEVYEGPVGRLMKIIGLNRKARFLFYSPIVTVMKITKMEPEI